MKFKTFITESKKETKEEVNFREGTPNKRCGLCTMFRPPASCTAVQGVIDAHDLCDLFERK